MASTLDQLLQDAPEWQNRAACAQAAAAEIFPQTLTGNGLEVSAAIAICWRCPVRVECGNHADVTEQQLGVWGGVDRGISPTLCDDNRWGGRDCDGPGEHPLMAPLCVKRRPGVAF